MRQLIVQVTSGGCEKVRSPIEVFLFGLQSVGLWKRFLAYTAVAGIVAWGLCTNTGYLLLAAMLIHLLQVQR